MEMTFIFVWKLMREIIDYMIPTTHSYRKNDSQRNDGVGVG